MCGAWECFKRNNKHSFDHFRKDKKPMWIKKGLYIDCPNAHLLQMALLRAIHRGVSTEPNRDLLCSLNVWGLWQFYLGRSQPSCTADRFIKNLMMGILKTLQCFYLTDPNLRLNTRLSYVAALTTSNTCWLLHYKRCNLNHLHCPASTATCVAIIADGRVLANRFFFNCSNPFLVMTREQVNKPTKASLRLKFSWNKVVPLFGSNQGCIFCLTSSHPELTEECVC